MRAARAILALLVAGGLLLSNVAAPATQHTVTIEGMQFNPPQLTVHRGERILGIHSSQGGRLRVQLQLSSHHEGHDQGPMKPMISHGH